MNPSSSRWSLPIVLVAAILHLALWLLLIREVFLLPWYEQQFQQYNMRLPALTLLFFSFFKAAEPVPAIWFVFPVADGIVLFLLHRKRQLLLLILWSILILFLLALGVGVLVLGMQLAVIKLQEGLSR
jgi:hypothetical protein